MGNAGGLASCRINTRQQEITHIQSDTKRAGRRKLSAKCCIYFTHGIISIGQIVQRGMFSKQTTLEHDTARADWMELMTQLKNRAPNRERCKQN